METKKTKTVISKEAKLRAKNYMRLKEGYVEPKQEPCDNCNNDVCCCIIRTQETLEEDFKIWDDLFRMLAWKFKPTKKW